MQNKLEKNESPKIYDSKKRYCEGKISLKYMIVRKDIV